MRALGQLLLWVGVIAAALVSVSRTDAITWEGYAAAIALGLVGVALIRRSGRIDAGARARIAEDLATLERALASAIASVDALVDEGEPIDVYAVKDRIDREIAEHLARFVDAREAMIPTLGLDAYAEVMGDFAGGERLLNRAWSASADGYIDEVQVCLGQAQGLLHAAQERLTLGLSRARADIPGPHQPP